tara:strand:+ start:127 stop:438 length:312 start_codon:yes stop_codon:yes gene_type:complete
MNTALKPIANLLSTHLGKPKPKRVDWSGKVRRLMKKHPELEIRLELWDKNEYGNHYYIYFKKDIEEKILCLDEELNALCNNMEGVYDQLVDRLDLLKREERLK